MAVLARPKPCRGPCWADPQLTWAGRPARPGLHPHNSLPYPIHRCDKNPHTDSFYEGCLKNLRQNPFFHRPKNGAIFRSNLGQISMLFSPFNPFLFILLSFYTPDPNPCNFQLQSPFLFSFFLPFQPTQFKFGRKIGFWLYGSS